MCFFDGSRTPEIAAMAAVKTENQIVHSGKTPDPVKIPLMADAPAGIISKMYFVFPARFAER